MDWFNFSYTPEEKILRAKVQLQETKPFFSYLLMNMRQIKTDALGPDTPVGVDARGHLYYRGDFIDKLSPAQVEGLLCHEVLHVALQHLLRLEGRDKGVFNIANDLIVNDVIKCDGMQLPAEGLIPQNHSYTLPNGYVVAKINEKFSEELYAELMKHLPKKDNGSGGSGKGKGKPGDGSGGGGGLKRFDEHMYGELSEAEKQAVRDEWNQRLAEATVYAKDMGLLPSGIERWVDGLLEGKVNWRHKLYKYITNELVVDFTWSRPHKKSLSTGVYMPNVLRERIEMVVSVDTSGSIGNDELKEFLTEIVSIARSFANVDMELVVCDAKIHDTYRVQNGDIERIMALKMKGGGGTSHRPVVDFVKDERPGTRLLISLTDGYSDIKECFPDLPSGCNRIIVLTTNSVPEKELEGCGEVVKIGG